MACDVVNVKIYKNNDQLRECIRSFAFRNEYDVIASDIVRKIFDRIKNSLNSFCLDEDGFNIQFNVKKDETQKKFYRNFEINARLVVKPNVEEDIPEMIINFDVKNNFSEKDYNDLNFCLYEVIRHELEHYHKIIKKQYPDDEYMSIYKQLINSENIVTESDLEEQVRFVSSYILSEVEIDCYVRSIMYIAKKQDKTVVDIVRRLFNRAFFGNDSRLLSMAQKNKGVMRILDETKDCLMKRMSKYYPEFKEIWL